jgi:hypothetical protein
MMDCDDPSHEWLVHLRSDYIVEVHAATREMAEEVALERADNGEYEMGKTAEAVDVRPDAHYEEDDSDDDDDDE